MSLRYVLERALLALVVLLSLAALAATMGAPGFAQDGTLVYGGF